MDPNVVAGIVNTVSAGAWAILAGLGRRGELWRRGYRQPSALLFGHRDLSEIIRRALDESQQDEELRSFPTSARLVEFLRSPECSLLIRDHFASAIMARDPDVSLRRSLQVTLAAQLDVPEHELDSVSRVLDRAIRVGVDHAIEKSIGEGFLLGHELAASWRQRTLLQAIQSVEQTVTTSRGASGTLRTDYLEFEEKYRRATHAHFAMIRPPNLDSGRKVSLDRVFVPPTLVSGYGGPLNESSETVDLAMFLAGSHRTVVLGNPGGGKSTLLAKISTMMAGSDIPVMQARRLTPMHVLLREYAVARRLRQASITDYIEEQVSATFQLKRVEGAVQYLIACGRAIILLDGLDELIETADRRVVAESVEHLARVHPSVPIIVTSRQVGYDLAPLDEDVFQTYRVAPFDNKQVAEYARNWFLSDGANSTVGAQMAKAFTKESATVADLRSNPLLLSLMCGLYTGHKSIPSRRSEVYEKCALMLFERWDRDRRIAVRPPVEAHRERLIRNIAHWIYADSEMQDSGVTRAALVQQVADRLKAWQFRDGDRAMTTADAFVSFCTGRAWVFSDTGTRAAGEPLFQFTHRTFLEFFAACYLTATRHTPELLLDELLPHIRQGEWDSVVLLAVQRMDRSIDGAGERILRRVLELITGLPHDVRGNLLQFCARVLEFVVPPPDVAETVADLAIGWTIQSVRTSLAIRSRRRAGSAVIPLLSALIAVHAENQATVRAQVERTLATRLKRPPGPLFEAAADVTFNLNSAPQFPRQTDAGDEERDMGWKISVEKVLADSRESLRKAAARSQVVASELISRQWMTVDELIDLRGPQAMFIAPRAGTLGNVYRLAPADELLRRVAVSEHASSMWAAKQVARIGVRFDDHNLPWVVGLRGNSAVFTWALGQSGSLKDRPRGQTPEIEFGTFILLATEYELAGGLDVRASSRGLGRLGKLLAARRTEISEAALDELLTDLRFGPRHGRVLTDWVRGKISFVG